MVNGRKIEANMVKGSVCDGVVGESTLGIAQVKSNCYSVNYGLAELEFSMANHRFCNVATPANSPGRSPCNPLHGTQLSRQRGS
jgi:hypothetical protein